MAAGVTIKHKRKAGAFSNGELAAGEWGLDVSGSDWYYSANGTTVVQLPTGSGSGDMLESEYATNGAAGKVDTAINAEQLGGTAAADYALESYVDTAVANIVDAAPGTLNTLNELAAALGDDANYASTVTTALAGKQPIDADLTAIAGISPSNDDVIQRKSGAWTNRSMAQVKSDLSLAKADVGLGNVANVDQTVASNITSGDIAAARMQTNVAAALQASGSATISNASITLDGGTI